MNLNYSSKINVDLLKAPLKSVLPKHNMFFPLTLNEEFYRENPKLSASGETYPSRLKISKA